MTRQRQILTLFSLLLTMTGVHISSFCFSQDSIQTKILVIERTYKENVTFKHPPQNKIKIGDRISLTRYSNDSVIKGKLESLTDTSIILNGNQIVLKDIRKINTNIGENIVIAGLSMILLSGALFIYADIHSQTKDNFGVEDENSDKIIIAKLEAVMGIIFGSVVAIIGATSFDYAIDKKWKIYVTTIDKKK